MVVSINQFGIEIIVTKSLCMNQLLLLSYQKNKLNININIHLFMLLGNRYIAKLYLLAKQGNKEEFKKIVKESNILNNLNELNGKEASILIYGYNKLKVFDHES